jgi:hypothetical protein
MVTYASDETLTLPYFSLHSCYFDSTMRWSRVCPNRPHHHDGRGRTTDENEFFDREAVPMVGGRGGWLISDDLVFWIGCAWHLKRAQYQPYCNAFTNGTGLFWSVY